MIAQAKQGVVANHGAAADGPARGSRCYATSRAGVIAQAKLRKESSRKMGGRGGRYDSIVRECVSTVPSAGGEKLLFLEWGEECETGFGGAAARDARHSQGEQDAYAGKGVRLLRRWSNVEAR